VLSFQEVVERMSVENSDDWMTPLTGSDHLLRPANRRFHDHVLAWCGGTYQVPVPTYDLLEVSEIVRKVNVFRIAPMWEDSYFLYAGQDIVDFIEFEPTRVPLRDWPETPFWHRCGHILRRVHDEQTAYRSVPAASLLENRRYMWRESTAYPAQKDGHAEIIGCFDSWVSRSASDPTSLDD